LTSHKIKVAIQDNTVHALMTECTDDRMHSWWLYHLHGVDSKHTHKYFNRHAVPCNSLLTPQIQRLLL